jgi:hypothetical protein
LQRDNGYNLLTDILATGKNRAVPEVYADITLRETPVSP